MEILVLIALAILPPLGIAYYVYHKDIHEKEPISLVVKSFAFGAFSVVPVLLVSEMWSVNLIGNIFIYAMVGVALIEEGFKLLFLKKFIFPNPEFNEPFDGIVYAVMVSLGFATVENIFYVFGCYDDGITVGIMRMFTAIPLHAACGVVMGYFVGLAKFKHDGKRNILLLKGLICAVIIHGLYDYFIFQGHLFILSLVTLFIAIKYSKKAIKMHQDISPFKKD